ncbi:MAG: hypothetical protein KVP17_000904 [Porospora cf. gigantea B]|uniref:uncharacterized protein n=1 Tax=Porospora cf. gigantea B TaxID=2853592 RepID=UPI0035719679|nr:MAG: hypothetical protein KVP17_000904 [Porospora cf. gigantea B]
MRRNRSISKDRIDDRRYHRDDRRYRRDDRRYRRDDRSRSPRRKPSRDHDDARDRDEPSRFSHLRQRRERSRSPKKRQRSDDRDDSFRSRYCASTPVPRELPAREVPGPEREVSSEAVDEEMDVAAVMGFEDFDTTKNKDHSASDLSGVNRKSKRKYRQFMNRQGGFNRPLSPVF